MFSGKTALHWAAAVNNVEAAVCLLQHGANRDAQDNHDQTPLFLTAKEGNFEGCRSLLDHYANRDITDHMDHLPRDVAEERRHQDIVKLLDEYRVENNPQSATGGHPYHGMDYLHVGSASGSSKKMKRKSKSLHTLKDPGDPMSPNKGQVVKLPAVQKKKKKKKAAAAAAAAGESSRESLESTADLPPSYESACAHMSQPNLHMPTASTTMGSAAYKDLMDYDKEENLSPEAWLDNVPSINPAGGGNAPVSTLIPSCISP